MDSIEDRAEKLYNDDLLYHNFDHIVETLETAMQFVWACFSLGIEVNAQVIYYAILFHDSGHHEDHKKKGFKTKEEYASSLAENVLSEYGFEKDFINKIKECILGTHVDAKLETNEQKIVRAADIYNMSGDYQEFLDKNLTLREEAEKMSGEKIEWDNWKSACKGIIEKYLSQKLVLDDEFELLSSADIKKNLNSFLDEDIEDLKSRRKVLFPKK